MIDLQNLTIKKAYEAMKAGEYTVLNLAEAYLGEIEKKNPELNAYLEVFEDARGQAEKADQMFKDGSATLMTGIPMGIKDNILFGLLRLRFPNNPFMEELKGCAIVRELHVYGKSLNIGEKGKDGQHIGIGKKLMKEAERITKEKGYEKLAVISGVGVREYYKKLGYELIGPYMIKEMF